MNVMIANDCSVAVIVRRYDKFTFLVSRRVALLANDGRLPRLKRFEENLSTRNRLAFAGNYPDTARQGILLGHRNQQPARQRKESVETASTRRVWAI